MYLLVKHIHMTTVALSFSLFVLRIALRLRQPDQTLPRWLKILPHINDTVLLISAITLAVMLQQYPFIHGWLTVKVLLLCLYIVLGMIAIKRMQSRAGILATGIAASACFGYIVAVALSHSPVPPILFGAG